MKTRHLAIALAAVAATSVNVMATEHLKSVNPAYIDNTVPAADDFYHHVNNGWLKAHPLTPEYARYGTLRRSLKWLKDEGLIEMKRLEDGIFIRVCGYDFIMGFRRKGEEIPAKAAFLALEEAERRMGGRSMQFDCCSANGEGGMQ